MYGQIAIPALLRPPNLSATVREALIFSAILRQPAHIPREEKIAYVDEVITLLEMDAYADAVVGVPGEGKPIVHTVPLHQI